MESYKFYHTPHKDLLETNPLRERKTSVPQSRVYEDGTEKCKKQKLVKAVDLPEWATVYPHIADGYRDPKTHTTIASCALSAFAWNTETVNVQLHLWAAFGHIFFMLWALDQHFFLDASPEGKLAALFGFLGSIICEFSSATAHTFHILSPKAKVSMWRLDYLAMVFVFFGSSWTGAWYLFGVYNRPVFYAVQGVSALIAFACLHQIWFFERFLLVNIFALWAFIPFTVWMLIECYFPGKIASPSVLVMREACTWLVLCSASSIVGGVFYFFKFPECAWNPNGALNFVGNSHNILHVFVVAACTTGILSTFSIAKYESIIGLL